MKKHKKIGLKNDIKCRTHSINEVVTRGDVNRVVIAGEQIVKMDVADGWRVSRIYTDYIYRGDASERLIVVIDRRREKNEKNSFKE